MSEHDYGAVNADDLPAEDPADVARAIQRTKDFIQAHYGDGPLPRIYSEGVVLFTEDDDSAAEPATRPEPGR